MSDRCVVCRLSAPRHGGLCCAHRYDEQPPCRGCERMSRREGTPWDSKGERGEAQR